MAPRTYQTSEAPKQSPPLEEGVTPLEEGVAGLLSFLIPKNVIPNPKMGAARSI